MNVDPLSSPADAALLAVIYGVMAAAFSLIRTLPHQVRNEAGRLRLAADQVPNSLPFDEAAACDAIRRHYRSARGIGIELLGMLMLVAAFVTFGVLKEQREIRISRFFLVLFCIATASNWLTARLHRKSILKAVRSHQ